MEAYNDDYQDLEEPMPYRLNDDSDLYIQLVEDMLPHGKLSLMMVMKRTKTIHLRFVGGGQLEI